jgi:predicted enzyme related to lactoylglutathione lyase
MKRFAIPGIAIALLVSAVPAQSPETTRDHEWLKQLVGEWDVQFKMYMQPEVTGTDSVRALGDHWVVAETRTTMMGVPFSGRLSLGHDPLKGPFHATWIDSMGGHLWVYEGTLDEQRDTLTLATEGPSMEAPGETARYREVIQITGKDTRTFTSSMEAPDGTWLEILTAEYRRRGDSPAPEAQEPTNEAELLVQYLEVVTTDLDATCEALAKLHGVTFGPPAVGFGNARTAALGGGGRIGVREPMREDEEPLVRPYVLVDDIEAALRAAEAAGAEIAMTATEIPDHGRFAIYFLGGIQYGLWEL